MSVRVPMVIRWPRHVAPGTVSNEIMSLLDFVPSIDELIERETSSDQNNSRYGRRLLGYGIACLEGARGSTKAARSDHPSVQEPARPRHAEIDARNVPVPPRFEVKAPAGAPNVVIVLIDDMGFGVPTTFGGPVSMPALDAQATQGLRYNKFHMTAVCSPTRAALKSGRNHHTVNMAFVTELAMLGARDQGLRLTLLCLDQRGELATLTSSVAELGGNIISLGTFWGEDASNAIVTMKVSGVDKDALVERIKPHVLEVIDVRQI